MHANEEEGYIEWMEGGVRHRWYPEMCAKNRDPSVGDTQPIWPIGPGVSSSNCAPSSSAIPFPVPGLDEGLADLLEPDEAPMGKLVEPRNNDGRMEKGLGCFWCGGTLECRQGLSARYEVCVDCGK